MQSLLHDIGLPCRSLSILWCDNIGAIYMSSNPVFHARTKHIELDFYYVHEQVAKDNIQIGFLSSKDKIGDIFTKPLSVRTFTNLVSKLRLVSSTHWLAGGC